MKLTVELLELENLANEEITVTMSDLGVGDVDHIVIDVKVQLKQKMISIIVQMHYYKKVYKNE